MRLYACLDARKIISYSTHFFRRCGISFCILIFSVTALDEIYYNRFELGAIVFLINVHDFFNSESGKPLLGPALVLVGAVVGIFTTFNNTCDRFFWIDFTFFFISGLLLLWILMQITPPTPREIRGLLEVYGLKPNDNPLSGILSLIIASLSAWLANRLKLRSAPAK